MQLLAAPGEVAAAFAALDLPKESEGRRQVLQSFCRRWLLPPEADLRPAIIPELTAGPPPNWLPLVQDARVRRWAESLFQAWGPLCREVRCS
jgi:hypothetical protein